ncbi:hypothetical protein N9154_02765 [Akkermansiaceae bacterium]|nr:hypothetical protein [Akkermansiaceae bacterium]
MEFRYSLPGLLKVLASQLFRRLEAGFAASARSIDDVVMEAKATEVHAQAYPIRT